MVKKAKPDYVIVHWSNDLDVKQLAALVGTYFLWSPPRAPDSVQVLVKVDDVRLSYGRREALVSPATGLGEGWVQFATLNHAPELPAK